jgi:hypothetical protein
LDLAGWSLGLFLSRGALSKQLSRRLAIT